MDLKLAVVTLWVEEIGRATDFYRDILGLPLLMMDRGRPHFDLGGAYLVILPGRPHQGEGARFPVLTFAVDDIARAARQLESHGIDLPWGIEEDSDSRWIMFKDPGGNLLEITQFGKGHPA